MSVLQTNLYDSSKLNATSYGSMKFYTRDASAPLNGTIQEASNIGSLVKNETQLDVASALSRANPQQFYKFALTGDNIKMDVAVSTESGVSSRIQVLNSSGKVIADNSTFASTELQASFALLNSSNGLDADAGDYFVKASYDATSKRSVNIDYTIYLYSGTQFSTSYKTVAKPQTKDTQVLIKDQTMTYSTLEASSFGTKAIHFANETSDSAVNIGWIYKEKSALAVKSRLTDVTKEQFYTFTLQDGEDMRFAFNNHTDTQDIRVQIFDSSGTVTIADSHGTDKQKAAYASLNSKDGLDTNSGVYLIKVGYAEAGNKKNQVYDFKLFSGSTYETLYTTTAATESIIDALYSGHLSPNYNTQSALAAYLEVAAEGGSTDVMAVLSTKF